MMALTIASTVEQDGSVHIPREAFDALGLRPGDEIRVRIEAPIADPDYQAELHRLAAAILDEVPTSGDQPNAAISDWGLVLEEKAHRLGLKI